MGHPTAATRPLLGWVTDQHTMQVASSDQSGVPAGFVRVENVADNFARIFNYVSIGSHVKKAFGATAEVNGTKVDDADVFADLDLSFTVHPPLPIGGVSVGVGHEWDIESGGGYEWEVRGWGVRASVAPIAQLSFDFARTWGGGTITSPMGMDTEHDGTRTHLGGTLLLFGWRSFRFGVGIAKTWTDTNQVQASSWTYELVGTMY